MNHAVHRRSHEALMRKKRMADAVEKRQFDFPIFTDPFPPIFPGRPRPTPDPPVIIEEPPIIIRPTPTPTVLPPPVRPPPRPPVQEEDDDPETLSTPSIIVIPTSSSSSSSSSLAIPTTSSTRPPPVPTTSSTPPPPPPPPPPATSSEALPLVTVTSYVRSASASGAAASGVVEQAGSTASAPAIAGGVMGGLVGLGAIAFFVVFLLRRRKQQREQDTSFDPYDFRRSAMQVQEPKDTPPPSGGQPQMSERQLPMTPDQQYGQYNEYGFNQQSPYPAHGGHYSNGAGYNTYGDTSPAGNLAGYGAGNMAGHQQQQQQQWAPGQIVSPGIASHYAANPFMNPAPYNESPFTPTSGSPAPIQINTNTGGANLSRTPSTPSTASTSHYPVGFPASPVDVERSLSRAGTLSRSRSGTLSRSNTLNGKTSNGTVLAEIGGAAVLTRSMSQKSSNGGHKKDLSIAVPANPTTHTIMAINTPTSAALPPVHHHLNVTRAAADAPITAQSADDYVDLTRASVSPFQAAQYAEISKRLNTEVPNGLTPPMLEQYVSAKQASELPALPPPSPLSPTPAPAQSMYPAAVVAAAATALAPPAQARVRDSTDSTNSTRAAADLSSFPIPPPSPLLPPAPIMSSPTRIDSRPPRLPEIAFRTSAVMSSGWVDTPPGSTSGHRDVDSPISPVSPVKGASSLGHGTTYEYHQSFSASKGGEEIVAPAFPSGISALGGLASPMNGRFNLGAPAVPAAPAPVAAFQAPQQLSVPPSPAMSASTRMSSTSTVVADDQAASKAATLGKSPLKTELVVVGGVQEVPEGKKQRPETVYDPEDAYGGI